MPSPTPPKDSNRLLMILGALLVVLVLLAHASASWYEDVLAKTTAPSLPQALGGTTGVVSAAWVDEGEVASADVLRIWILVENRTAALANNLQFLAFHTPGYRKTGICWRRGVPVLPSETCGGGRPSPRGLAKSLGPGESTIVYAELPQILVWLPRCERGPDLAGRAGKNLGARHRAPGHPDRLRPGGFSRASASRSTC